MEAQGTFYIDVFFITEWLMNSVVLLIYCALTGRRISMRKNLGVSFCTTGFSVIWFCLLCQLRWWNGGWAVVQTVVCAGLELVLLRPQKGKQLWKHTLLELPSLFLSSFLLAGSLLLFISGKSRGERVNGRSIRRRTGRGKSLLFKGLLVLILTGMICCFLTLRNWRKASETIRKRKRVWISLEGKTYTVTAIIDTGNHLYEKRSGYPVHIVEMSCLFTGEEMHQLMQERPERFCWVPYASLGNPSGILPVLQVDQMVIEAGKENITLRDQRIGLTDQCLSKGEDWRMLLHPDFETIRKI